MKIVSLALVWWVALIAVAYAAEPVVAECPLMGTLFKVVVYPPEGAQREKVEAAIDQAFAIATQIDDVASDYKSSSELRGLNIRHGGRLSVTFAPIVREAERLMKVTDGAYDPGLGRLTVLWRESVKTRELPDPDALAHALHHSGLDGVRGWHNKTSLFSLDKNDGALPHLDLGGMAKGYAADRMFDHLKAAGYPRSAIVAGGDVRVGVAPPGRMGWPVTIRTARPDQDDLTILAVNAGVSTSGALYQNVVIDGVTYSHILDPKTGLGLTQPIAATVIAANATLSDALATAACVAGAEAAAAKIEDWGAISVRVVTDEGVTIPDADEFYWEDAK
ncbi:FAD:protein FMN transferase [Sulfuriroseicoccus oceanibius]|uniref:FAD:protein FMN transferase n=1 Tax=Sulfuriroseicoccus oceanibius TaxID=2707525 RepID=A0A6B3LFU1_9BACT|nr:FAD:protein FMN transferase [Sulfuriroseicoccus oceanibius]QQL45395.1 FAD:protein FMN transferase [Sulfuriroseicoccus oceanibius]